MDISALSGVAASYRQTYLQDASLLEETSESFDSIFTSMLNSLDETNSLQKAAESEETESEVVSDDMFEEEE